MISFRRREPASLLHVSPVAARSAPVEILTYSVIVDYLEAQCVKKLMQCQQ